MSDQPQTVVNVNLTAPVPGAAPGMVLLKPKSTGMALVLWLCFGGLGIHRFYLKRPHAKTMLILTLVGLAFSAVIIGIPILFAIAIWVLIDLFFIAKWVAEYNSGGTPGATAVVLAQQPQPAVVLAQQPQPAVAEEPKDLQTLLLHEAEKRDGRLTVTHGVMATGKTFKEVEACLGEMVSSGYVDVDNEPESGVVVYVFAEMS